jgi:hypothetical protein
MTVRTSCPSPFLTGLKLRLGDPPGLQLHIERPQLLGNRLGLAVQLFLGDIPDLPEDPQDAGDRD